MVLPYDETPTVQISAGCSTSPEDPSSSPQGSAFGSEVTTDAAHVFPCRKHLSFPKLDAKPYEADLSEDDLRIGLFFREMTLKSEVFFLPSRSTPPRSRTRLEELGSLNPRTALGLWR